MEIPFQCEKEALKKGTNGLFWVSKRLKASSRNKEANYYEQTKNKWFIVLPSPYTLRTSLNSSILEANSTLTSHPWPVLRIFPLQKRNERIRERKRVGRLREGEASGERRSGSNTSAHRIKFPEEGRGEWHDVLAAVPKIIPEGMTMPCDSRP